MKTNPTARRKKFADELAKLREVAIAEMELRGYDVRGKTPRQIKRTLKSRAKRPK